MPAGVASTYMAGSGYQGGRGSASVGGAMAPLLNVFKQAQAAQSQGPLDTEALRNINLAQGNVESLFRNQLQGFHQNTGGSLLKQLAANRKALEARGLGGAIPLLGDMGTDREYNLTMGKLRDSWFSNLLKHQTGFLGQRTRVAESASNRLSNVLAQLAGLSSGLISANTPRAAYLRPGGINF